MSVKGRVKFSAAGQHPLLGVVRDLFISYGFALVPWDEQPDLGLVGAEIGKNVHPPLTDLELLAWKTRDIPTVLLSSDSVYARSTKERVPYAEKHAAVFCDIGKQKTSHALYSLLAENIFWTSREAATLILRPFHIYGPNTRQGVVYKFIQHAQRQVPLPIYGSGYQVRSFLHEEDFAHAVRLLVAKFVQTPENAVYNVGSSEQITIKRLADTIWGLTHGPGSTVLFEKEDIYRTMDLCKVPVIDRLYRATDWKPERSLRRGLRELLC